MSKLAIIVLALLAAGCATYRSEVAFVTAETGSASRGAGTPVIAAAEATAAVPLPEGIKTVEISEFEDGLVCESRKRTGTRISRNTCYTPEAYAAMQAAKREKAQRYIDGLEREQNMLGIQQRAIDDQQQRAMMGAGR
jgi:hypothetical protein